MTPIPLLVAPVERGHVDRVQHLFVAVDLPLPRFLNLRCVWEVGSFAEKQDNEQRACILCRRPETHSKKSIQHIGDRVYGSD